LKFLRISKQSDSTFFTGTVWAEMKKATSYKVDVALDSDNVVVEAQCECGAGQGPSAHCKHVGCLLYAIHQVTCNKTLLTELTCTQQLQTFHHVKAYGGTPLKADQLNSIRKTEFIYDPRPLQFRNKLGYSSHFRNTVLNYDEASAMPVFQLYSPANPYDVAAVHNYCGDVEELFLKTFLISQISGAEIEALEANTRGQANSALWKEERCKRITSSNFGVVCKATERRDLNILAKQLVTPKEFYSAPTAHGRKYEAVAVEKFEELYQKTNCSGMFVCHKYPWLAASPDRLVNTDAVLEIKCPFAAFERPINSKTVPYLKLDDNNNLHLDTTHNYYYQVQGQILCTGRNVCYFCVYTKNEFYVEEIARDDCFIAAMIEKLNKFFTEFFRSAVLDKYYYKNYKLFF
jgi:putative phage-type endonuclease